MSFSESLICIKDNIKTHFETFGWKFTDIAKRVPRIMLVITAMLCWSPQSILFFMVKSYFLAKNGKTWIVLIWSEAFEGRSISSEKSKRQPKKFKTSFKKTWLKLLRLRFELKENSDGFHLPGILSFWFWFWVWVWVWRSSWLLG